MLNEHDNQKNFDRSKNKGNETKEKYLLSRRSKKKNEEKSETEIPNGKTKPES